MVRPTIKSWTNFTGVFIIGILFEAISGVRVRVVDEKFQILDGKYLARIIGIDSVATKGQADLSITLINAMTGATRSID